MGVEIRGNTTIYGGTIINGSEVTQSATLQDLVYTIDLSNLYLNLTDSPGDYLWQCTNNLTPVWADGLSTLGIPANQDGYVQSQITIGQNCQEFGFALHTSATIASNPFYNIASYLIYNGSGGTFWYADSGNFNNSGIPVIDEDLIGLRRTGSVITAEYYRGGSWTVIHTFSATTTAKLYAGVAGAPGNGYNINIKNPKGFNLA